jgi:hypothetical protein
MTIYGQEPIIQPQREARFWYYVNGCDVLIKLRPGQCVQHVHGGPTDEGYSYTANVWRHDGCGVYREWTVNAQDCDGRIDRHGDDYCPLSELRCGAEVDGRWFPAWHKLRRGQRDYSAEAMGY